MYWQVKGCLIRFSSASAVGPVLLLGVGSPPVLSDITKNTLSINYIVNHLIYAPSSLAVARRP